MNETTDDMQKTGSNKLRGDVAHLARHLRTSREACAPPHNVRAAHIAPSSGFSVQPGVHLFHTLAIWLNQVVSHLFGFFQ